MNNTQRGQQKRWLHAALIAGGLLSSSLGNAALAFQVGDLPLAADSQSKLLALSPEAIAKIYPAAQRPEAVYLTADKKVALTFEWRTTPMRSSDVANLVSQYPAVVKSQVPSLKALVSKQLTISGVPWGQFVYTLPSPQGERRRETLLTSLNKRLLLVSIDSTTADYAQHQTEVRSFINSLKPAQ